MGRKKEKKREGGGFVPEWGKKNRVLQPGRIMNTMG